MKSNSPAIAADFFSARRLAWFSLAAAFGFPFAALLIEIGASGPMATQAGAGSRHFGASTAAWLEIANAAPYSLAQAAVSALLALAVGAVGAAGLFACHARWPRAAPALRGLAILPSALPALAAVLAWASILPATRGFCAVVAMHALILSGVAAIAIERAARAKIGGMAELAFAEGSSRAQFARRGALPALRGDFASIGLFAFAACFASFAVPLALGGARAASLEMVSYQRALVSGDLAGALAASISQTLFIFAASSFAFEPGASQAGAGRASRLDLLAWSPGMLAILAPPAALAFALARDLRSGIAALAADGALRADLGRLAAGTFATSVLAGLAVMAALFLVAFARPAGWTRRVLLGYAAPSAVLTGLALTFALPSGDAWDLAKIGLGAALIAAPAMMRLRWDGLLEGLRGQILIARALGANDRLIFARIAAPQLWRAGCALSGLAAFWAAGDFALASVVSNRRATLAMASEALLSAYRMPASMAMMAIALVAGGLAFLLFVGAGHVDGS